MGKKEMRKKYLAWFTCLFLSFLGLFIGCYVVGSESGVVAAFVISLFLLAFQIRKGDFNPMKFASALYFTVAAVGTFIFNLHMFVENR